MNRLLAYALPHYCLLCYTYSADKMICMPCQNIYLNKIKTRCPQCALITHAPLANIKREPSVLRQESSCEDSIKNSTANSDDIVSKQMVLAIPCGICLKNQPYYDATYTVSDYRPPLDRLVLKLKWKAHLALADEFARYLAQSLIQGFEYTAMPQLILAVPLAPKRLAARGFNQAWEIAKRLAHYLKIPSNAQGLTRRYETPAQSMLNYLQRQKNLKQAFCVNMPVNQKHILVVDDVMTTGATLNEIAKTLKQHGAQRVCNAVVLRTPLPN